MPYHEPSWPKWKEVVSVWNETIIPEIEVLPFIIGKHYDRCPWWHKMEKQQDVGQYPYNYTASHIVSQLPKHDPELQMAYKIYAYCRENHLDSFPSTVLHPIFVKHGSALYDWWSGNARYVLPYLENRDRLGSDKEYAHSQAKEWKKIVSNAALSWKQISETWAIIRIPELMDQKSKEYSEYIDYCNRKYEQHEREEYKRLKMKFEAIN